MLLRSDAGRTWLDAGRTWLVCDFAIVTVPSNLRLTYVQPVFARNRPGAKGCLTV
jgi:hypothetical protein